MNVYLEQSISRRVYFALFIESFYKRINNYCKFLYVDGLVIIPIYNIIKRKELLKIQPTNLE